MSAPATKNHPSLRVARIHFPVTALGPGRRLGIWVQGCALACPGCMSRDTWDPAGGRALSVSDLAETWRRAAADGADGITVSGGEPLEQAAALAALLGQVRRQPVPAGTPDILVYTGYDLASACRRAPEVLRRADAVITGRFEVTKPTRLMWRGSANQCLVPLTPLGHGRYADYVNAETERPAIQIGSDSDGYWLIGVPRRGDLRRLERELGGRGLAVSGGTWRPGREQDKSSEAHNEPFSG